MNTQQITHPFQLILASASERRRKILADLGLVFHVVVTHVEEDEERADPERACRTNALRKLNACRTRHSEHGIIAADTVIEFDGIGIHKPADLNEAREFFRMFSGKTHRVLTAMALYSPRAPEPQTHLDVSSVTFRPLDDARIHEYFSHVDPLDKAGAYDIGQCADLIVESFRGSATNIMGLPVETLRPWLLKEGWL